MALGLEPAVEIHRYPPPYLGLALTDHLGTLPLLAEPQILVGHQFGNCEAIVGGGHVHVLGPELCHGVGRLGCPHGCLETHVAPSPAQVGAVGGGSDALDPYRGVGELLRGFLGGEHHGGGPVCQRAGVIQLQGPGDNLRAKGLFECNLLLELRQGVHGAVMVRLHGDPGQVLLGSPELVHMSHGMKGVVGWECHAVVLELPEIGPGPPYQLHGGGSVNLRHLLYAHGHRQVTLAAQNAVVGGLQGGAPAGAGGLHTHRPCTSESSVLVDDDRRKRFLAPAPHVPYDDVADVLPVHPCVVDCLLYRFKCELPYADVRPPSELAVPYSYYCDPAHVLTILPLVRVTGSSTSQ